MIRRDRYCAVEAWGIKGKPNMKTRPAGILIDVVVVIVFVQRSRRSFWTTFFYVCLQV